MWCGYMWPWMRKSVICKISILSNTYVQILIIQWFCTVGQYNLVNRKSNYCSTYIPGLVSCLCKIAEKQAFEYKHLTKFLFYKWHPRSHVCIALHLISCVYSFIFFCNTTVVIVYMYLAPSLKCSISSWMLLYVTLHTR